MRPPAGRQRRRGRERAILLAEILLVMALLIIAGSSTRGWLALRQKLPTEGITLLGEQALAAPATEPVEPEPAPAIRLRDLPLGRYSAPDQAEPQSRRLEPPAHLRAWLDPDQQAPAQPIPAPAVQAATRIIIPAINVDAPIGEGTDWEALKYRVGHHPGTANPGQRGNMVLAAHNDVYGEIFRYLPEVPVGEVITIYAGEQVFRYRIVERRIIRPEQTEVMLPTTRPTVTLISCYPYLVDTHRIVLFGELVE